MSVRQFVLDWDSKSEWTEWQFSGYQAWGGEQPDAFFWTPKSGKNKPAFSTEPLKELYEITQFVSRLDAPNRVQIMIRCPLANQSIVEPCIDKDFKFTGEWPTKYAVYTLKKPTRYSETYL